MIWLNEEPLEIGRFPGGEALLRVPLEYAHRHVNVRWKWEGDGSLVELLMVCDALREQHCTLSLEIMYMPYARMDRRIGNQPMTLSTVKNLVNSIGAAHVEVWEPHSNATIGRGDVRAVYPTTALLASVVEQTGATFIVFPDQGACDRYVPLLRENYGTHIIRGHKRRDQATGIIVSLDMTPNMPIVQGSAAVIVDDLCSYGGTFDWCAKALQLHGIGDVHLLVAHLETSVNKGSLLHPESPIKSIHCTDSLIGYGMHSKIVVHKREEWHS